MQATGYRLQATGCRIQASGYKLQAAGCRLQVAGYRLQATGCRIQAAGCKLENIEHKIMLVKLRNSFIAGITVLLPAVLTFIIVRYLLTTIDIYLLNPIVEFLKPYLSLYWMKYIAKALVLIIIFLSICLLGMAARNIIMSRLFRSMEKLFIKVPLVGRVYRAIKEISNAFLGEGRTIFHRVILLEYPRKGLYSIGFITRKGKGEVQQKTGKKVLSVFVPTTPNPTSGIYLLVPEEEIISLDMTVEEGLKLVISGGSVMPEFKLEGKSLR